MSMTGSLISYENHCDSSRGRQKRRVEIVHDSVANTAVGSTSSAAAMRSPRNRRKIHLNCLWSIWYGLCITGFQSYLAIQCTKRFLGFMSLPWPVQPPSNLEMNAYLVFLAVSVFALPFFLLAAVFKVGNLANDGFKLGRNLSTCTADPPAVLLGSSEGQSVFRSLWQHGGPTAPFLHLTTAFCLLLPKLMMEAKLIQSGFLPRDSVWKTDLDFMVMHRDRLLVLNFMTSPPAYSNSTSSPTFQPSTSTSVDTEELSLATVERGPKDLIISSFVEDSVLGFISPEFLNYALALLVYAVRYPSIFWNTNKWFGTLFSFQLLGNGIQSLLSFAGVSVLYKVHVVGAPETLPLLKKSNVPGSPFLLDGYFTLALFLLSSVLVLSSSLVLYLYGYGRFNAFINTERERKVISLREGYGGSSGWGYFTHCAALSVLLALAVCHAPLLHDYTIVYRGSLDGAVLACVATAILHLFLWVFIWLVLTVKQKWNFQLRVAVGRAVVRSARSVKLVTDVDLISCGKYGEDVTAPLLVVGNGRTYTIGEASPKRAIYNIIQKAAVDRKTRINVQGSQDQTDDDTEIYWLRPKPRSPKGSPSDSDRLNWFNKKMNSSQKHKVTFEDSVGREDTRDGKNHNKIEIENSSSMQCEDDGDYATLRMGPAASKIRIKDNISEDNKLLEHALRDDNVTFARSNELQPDYEDPSPLLTPEPNDMPLPPPPTTQTNYSAVPIVQNVVTSDKGMTVTPKCLRRADSGMPHEELTPRSGSVSSGSQSGSGGSPPGVQNSESSSGVHSNASSRRATSVDDLTVHQEPRQSTWKSCSLQRNVLPPNAPGSQQIYIFGQNPEQVQQAQVSSVPAVILENPCEDTVVIRRKSTRPLTADLSRRLEIKEEPFGRSTNMRMTSFTDECSSATLPHFPTQPPPTNLIYPCNTMPSSSSMVSPPPPPVVPIQPINLNTGYPRPHTTLPIHHNGIRLFPTPYAAKKFHYGIAAGISRLPKHNRDSANFSMASSGESDCHP